MAQTFSAYISHIGSDRLSELQLALRRPSAPKSDTMAKINGFPQRGEWESGVAEWQLSNSVGDPADRSVYSADTSNGRCEELDFSSGWIYCPLCPQLLSATSQSTGGVINFLKTLERHTQSFSSVSGCEGINLYLVFFFSPTSHWWKAEERKVNYVTKNWFWWQIILKTTKFILMKTSSLGV